MPALSNHFCIQFYLKTYHWCPYEQLMTTHMTYANPQQLYDPYEPQKHANTNLDRWATDLIV